MLVGWVCPTIVALHVANSPPACAVEVTRLFEAGQHVASARAAEVCWTTSRDPLLMYFTAQARAAAGQRSHAVVWLRRYLAAIPADAPLHAGAQRRLTELLDEVVAVTLVAPPGALEFSREGQSEPLVLDWSGEEGIIHLDGGVWRVRSLGGAIDAQMFTATAGARVVLHEPRATVSPQPRAWPLTVRIPLTLARSPGASLEIRAPGRPEQKLQMLSPSIRLSASQGPLTVTLRAAGRETVERSVQLRGPVELVFEPGLDRTTQARIGLGVGLGAASLALLGWGTGWMLVGRGKIDGSDLRDADDVRHALYRYGRSVDGALIVAVGVGCVGVAITDALKLQRTALVIETGFGLAALASGLLWGGSERRRWMESADLPAELLVERRPRATAAFVILGLGAGMTAAGAASLLALTAIGRRPDKVRRLEPLASPWYAGLRGWF